MSVNERFDRLLQKHLAGELTIDEVHALRTILLSSPEALDRYLDLCELDEHLSHPTGPSTSPRQSPATLPPPIRHSALWLTLVSLAASLLFAVGSMMPPSGDDSQTVRIAALSDVADVKDAAATPPRRAANPWKVIQSTGSMNHPRLLEASIPNVTTVSHRKLQFNRDIRPILSETCFHCHGPDEQGRRADLRLDTAEGATTDRGGYQPIAPGDLENSEAWRRIISEDPDLLMPPAESHLVLSDDQKTLLRRWIEEGAEYQGHWAFMAPVAPAVPDVDFTDPQADRNWSHNAIDSFVAARLAEAGMTPSVEAEPSTLIRRLTLDLIGLPPTVAETRDFVSDYESRGEAAYQDAITRLFQSPHFGERMTLPWLDQARYADTNGYSIDGGRDMWLWRDWVIQAYNDNMPYDQFVIEQLAGDLLPNASDGQHIATGFNRNHMITHEGGTIPEENLTNYTADRVKTTSEVFLGLTMGCAQCHDHKYDPISQKEYYQFFAFFNQLEDRGLDGNSGQNSAPHITAQTVLRSDELNDLEAELAQSRRQLAETTEGFDEWLDAQRRREKARGEGFQFLDTELLDVSAPNVPGTIEFEPTGSVSLMSPRGGLNGLSHSMRVSSGNLGGPNMVSGVRIEFFPQPVPVAKDSQETKPSLTPFAEGVPKVTTVLVSATGQPADQVDYHRQVAFVEATATSAAEGHPPRAIFQENNARWWQPADGESNQHLTLTFAEPADLEKTPYLSVLVVFGQSQSLPFQWRIRPFVGNDTDSPWDAERAVALANPEADGDAVMRSRLLSAFRESAATLETLRVRIANLEERHAVLTQKHSAMVMNVAAQPRQTFVLDRGQYDAPTEPVAPATPKILPTLMTAATQQDETTSAKRASEIDRTPETDDPANVETIPNEAFPQDEANRLDFAQWLVRPDHPLTSRVAVNRIWKIFFGTGLVATSADFGSQGEFPSHPELLDYLATHFVEIGWDQKQLIREIVSSATYRQQATATDAQLAIDPKNRLFARGPRFRLPAELIRDQALAVSGLLVRRIGGPSVQPYQPPALWKEVSHFGSTPATKQVFVQDHGEKLYRRSMYTIVKRTSPHPAMSAFDAPSREMCMVDRGTTNTPVQALVTLNDPQFAEAARVLAAALLREKAVADDQQRIRQAFQRVLCRDPNAQEIEQVAALLAEERARFAASPRDAQAAVSVGEWPPAVEIDPVEQAAWMQVATLLLNLSETMTRG
ncbi:Planctomycete cytochrome C [Rosistilla carotiformis]|uniref:Planctomycete cytochrome C n=1 Tax=Rosistilla carotiformis TaxID=2528017 RepID=A0A518JSI8_9BACT|nr:PSD1 and planctomycete cytochrome C domain-containing protein [Rosistilla carotiformis]QDV68497.1 Planctomycete cytochrome C [Rosistilla carotiformis]